MLLEEAIASAYRERRITMGQVRQLLGYGTRMQIDPFLQQQEIYDYTVEDFEKDIMASSTISFRTKAISSVIVVADTSPLNYLTLLGYIEVHELFPECNLEVRRP